MTRWRGLTFDVDTLKRRDAHVVRFVDWGVSGTVGPTHREAAGQQKSSRDRNVCATKTTLHTVAGYDFCP